MSKAPIIISPIPNNPADLNLNVESVDKLSKSVKNSIITPPRNLP